MSDQAWPAAVSELLRDEGVYQCDPNDRGNWTSGKVGVGVCKGTKYGISAMSYPALDIKNLAQSDAIAIIKRDWWLKYRINELEDSAAIKTLDIGFNMGMEEGITLLQKAINLTANSQVVVVDGQNGPHTIAACNEQDPASLHDSFCMVVASHYDDIVEARPEDAKYLNDWLKRAQE